MSPFGNFLVIHFEVGGHTRSLEYQEAFWPSAIAIVDLANQYDAGLTLQFSPKWAEFILKDTRHLRIIRGWQKWGHEIGLHHHGYVHGDWDGYTNRDEINDDPRFRGSVRDMMELMRQFVGPYQLLSGTISDEKFDYPKELKNDTEGIRIDHARSKPKLVCLGSHTVIQVGMAFLSFEGDIGSFKREYLKSKKSEIFGVVTHEKDFVKNPVIIEEWFKFIRSRGESIKTVSQILMDYQNAYSIEHNEKPLNFLNDVMGAVR